MKSFFTALVLLLSLTTALPLDSTESSTTVLSLNSSDPSTAPLDSLDDTLRSTGSYAKVAGHLFNIDGKVGSFAGVNAWWLAHLSSNKDIDICLYQIAATGYKVVRVWGFGDVNSPPPSTSTDPNRVYFQLLDSNGAHINYGPDGLQRLDYLVRAASRYGVKLVLNFINNWGAVGGIPAYGNAFGCPSTSFYTHERCQSVYKDYIKAIVTRYRTSTAIFAWQLANEPRCHGCPSSVLTKWATDISAFIKSLDQNHMVTLGDEGWLTPADGVGDKTYAYSGIEGIDWKEILKIKTLDYGTFHLYPKSWGYPYSWGSEWIEQHDKIAKEFGKPIILQEYGAPSPHDELGDLMNWQKTVLNSGIAADQFWQFGPSGTSVPVQNLADFGTIYYNTPDYKTLGTDHAKAMLARKV